MAWVQVHQDKPIILWSGVTKQGAVAAGIFHTPCGPGVVVASDTGVTSVEWGDEEDLFLSREPRDLVRHNSESPDMKNVLAAETIALEAVTQLEAYFAGARQSFDVPFDIRTGTEFQRDVWSYLCTIPYGQTRSYKDVASSIGREKAVRAVGQANRRNPLSILIPCHRVVGSNGALTGYAGSQVHLKAALLELEQKGLNGMVSGAARGLG